jgi:hypothetical protein
LQVTSGFNVSELVPRMDWLLIAMPPGFVGVIEPGMIAPDVGQLIPAAVSAAVAWQLKEKL